MAALTTTADTLRVELTAREKLASLHGSLEFPLGAIGSVVVEADPLRAVRGFRAPGVGLPGRTKLGTWRRRGGKCFAVARRGQSAVRIDLVGSGYDRLVVSVPDADATAELLRGALERHRRVEGP